MKNKIRRILVAVKDPEARSIPVLAKAAQLARGLNSRLELFHAMTWPIYAASDPDFQAIKTQEPDRARTRLDRLAARVGGSGRRQLQISTAAVWDSPSPARLDTAILDIGAMEPARASVVVAHA